MAIDPTIENYAFVAKEILVGVRMFSNYVQKIQSLTFGHHN